MWRPRQPGAEEEPGGTWIGLVDGGGESRPPHAPAPLAGRRAWLDLAGGGCGRGGGRSRGGGRASWRRACGMAWPEESALGGSKGGRRRPGRERPTSRQPWWSASPWWPAALAHVPVQASPARDPAGAVTPSDTERKLRRPPLFRPPRAAPSNPPCSGHLASIPPATSRPATSALFPNHQSGCSLPAASFRWRPEPPWLSQGPPP